VLQSTGSLDHLALHEQLRLMGGNCPRCRLRLRSCDCGGTCARCRGGLRRFEAVGFETTPRRPGAPAGAPAGARIPAPRQTPPEPAGSPFGAWSGWSRDPVTLAELMAARTQLARTRGSAARRRAVPPALRPFFRPGPKLYRITLPTATNPRYLSIGMTASPRQTIAGRVSKHYNNPDRRRSSGERNLHQLMRSADPSRILVQAGNLPDNMPVRTAHMYEIWLQRRERVSDWRDIRDTRTFETALDQASEAFAELEALG